MANLCSDLYNALVDGYGSREFAKPPGENQFKTPSLNYILGFPLDATELTPSLYGEERNFQYRLTRSMNANILQAYLYLAAQHDDFTINEIDGFVIGVNIIPKEVVQYEYDQMLKHGKYPGWEG